MTVSVATRAARRKPGAAKSTATPPASARELAAQRTLELVFFAHMEMADAADQVLAEHQLGRPHHRLLYFAAREPGITVGSLLSLLRISNQAMSRTMNQLTALGLLEQRYSTADRRVRQNFVTAAGLALLRQVTERQIQQIAAHQEQLSTAQLEGMWNALSALARPEDLKWWNAHPTTDPSGST